MKIGPTTYSTFWNICSCLICAWETIFCGKNCSFWTKHLKNFWEGAKVLITTSSEIHLGTSYVLFFWLDIAPNGSERPMFSPKWPKIHILGKLDFRPWSTKVVGIHIDIGPGPGRNYGETAVFTFCRKAENWQKIRFFLKKSTQNLLKKSTQNLLKDWYFFGKMVLFSLVQTQTLNSLFTNLIRCRAKINQHSMYSNSHEQKSALPEDEELKMPWG